MSADGLNDITSPNFHIVRCALGHRRHQSIEYSQQHHRSEIMELSMSLLHRINVSQGPNQKAVRKYPEYGFVLALIVMALALVTAKYSHQHPLVWFGP
jgi:hypothetical protein